VTDAAGDHEDPPRRFAAWSRALAPRVPDFVRAYLPGSPIDARRRELLVATVAAALGCEPLERLHLGWHDLLGPAELSELDDDVAVWAVATALAGPDGATVDLPEELSGPARRAALALVAHTAATAAAFEASGVLVRRLLGRAEPAGPIAGQVLSVVGGLAIATPTAAAGAVVGALGRLVPPAPVLEVDPDPNLLAQLLAEILPTWFGSAWGRTLVAALPVQVPVGVRSGRTGATVRVGEGRLTVTNLIAPDVWAVFDGEVDALVRAGSLALTRELRADRLPR
jgi:hypothetical protein